MRSSEQDRKDCNESRKTEPGAKRRFWRRLFLGLLVVLALYSLAGFWLLPRILVTQLQKKGPELLDREVTVDRVRLLKERDGHTNLDTILRTPPAPASPAKGRVAAAGAESGSGTPPEVEKTGRKGSGDTGSDAFHFSLETLRLSRGQFSFADYSVSPPFKMVLDKLDGEISGLTSTGRRPAKVSLTGRLNGQAPVVVSGEVNPLAEDLYVDLKISGKSVGLTSLSPYSRKYVGYLVGKGKTTFDLEYRIKNRVLAGRNTIFIDQFDFGSRVESPDATSLPVKLALSLLRDRKGEIHLDLPVRGDLDDPEFSLGGVILKVFVNLITKAVTSPFFLLSGLAGSGEELNQVDFANWTITPPRGLTSWPKSYTTGPDLKLRSAAGPVVERIAGRCMRRPSRGCSRWRNSRS